MATGLADALLHRAEAALRGALGLRPGSAAPPVADDTAMPAFVSLHVDGELNGCIGDLRAERPLAEAVPRLALAAAFEDPRLPPLRPRDLGALSIELSLLANFEDVPAADRSTLQARLRPGHDGLILHAGRHQALFLPSVWEQLPAPDDFVDHLLAKAGLHPGSWPRRIAATRFHAHRRTRLVDGAGGDEALMPRVPSADGTG